MWYLRRLCGASRQFLRSMRSISPPIIGARFAIAIRTAFGPALRQTHALRGEQGRSQVVGAIVF